MENSATSATPISDPPPFRQAVIFLRARVIPSNNTAETAGLEEQRRICRQLAQSWGVTVIREYVARGGTTDSAVREEIEAMLCDAAAEQVDVILTVRLDRFTRRWNEAAALRRKLETAGVRLMTADGDPWLVAADLARKGDEK